MPSIKHTLAIIKYNKTSQLGAAQLVAWCMDTRQIIIVFSSEGLCRIALFYYLYQPLVLYTPWVVVTYWSGEKCLAVVQRYIPNIQIRFVEIFL